MQTMLAAFRLSLVAALLTVLAGCASADKSEEVVTPEARAQQRWDALLAGDFLKAYTYLSPGMRSEMTAEAYAAQIGARPIRWGAAEVVGAECGEEGDGNLCRVSVKVDFTAPANTPGLKRLGATTVLVERWILVDGQWYFVSRKVAAGR